MLSKTQSVIAGLDAKSSALLVQTANRFKSDIRIKTDKGTANAKSFMSIISLSILEGQELSVITEGEDENEAQEAVTAFFDKVKDDTAPC